MNNKAIDSKDFIRLANNFYNAKGLPVSPDRIFLDSEFVNFISQNQGILDKKYKVALVCICLNPLYWQFAYEMVMTARKFFLPGHQTEFFFWTDIPDTPEDIIKQYKEGLKKIGLQITDEMDLTKSALQIADRGMIVDTPNILNGVISLRSQKDIHLVPTEPVDWPYPTLLRYNLFLQEEEKLKDFDYIIYCDIDMRFVDFVGDEILPQKGLVAAPHPGYYIRKQLYPPYEPNPDSASYIKRPGRLVDDGGKPRFRPEYYAGGLQGGKADAFIHAMKECKKLIEKDLNKSYIPIWNDETAWNKYLSENPPEIFLTPSYIYPDSLIKEYYEPTVWGRSFKPILITITKWFSLSKEAGQETAKMLQK